jgi:hypothetical protein
MSEASSSLHDESQPLLIARIRVGALLVGLSILLYGMLELWQQRAPLAAFFAVEVVQIAAIAIVWLALDRAGSWRRTVLLALALVAEICVTLAISGILTREVASAPILYVLVTLGTATLLPWGLAPQAATVVVAVASLAINAAVVPTPDGFGYTVTAAVLAFLASLAVAYQLDEQRRQRHQAEDEERASASALRDEIAIAEASTHAARELLATGDAAEVVATLCRLETRLLDCEASYTFLRDAHDAKSFAVVACDGDSAAQLTSRRALRIPDISLARVIDRLGKDEPVVVTGERDLLPVDGAVCVYTALMAGHDVTGIQVAVRRALRPFKSADVELARRLAHTASAALAQARLLDTGARRAGAAGVGGRVWHELQTPLSSILRLAEHAGDVSLPPAERRALAMRIASTARDVLRMLERLEHDDPATGRDGKIAQG